LTQKKANFYIQHMMHNRQDCDFSLFNATALQAAKNAVYVRQVVAMNYAPGAHSAEPVGHSPLRIYRSVEHGGRLKLLHYKYLSFAYVHRRHSALKRRLGKEFSEHGFGLHYQYSQLRHLRRFLKRYLRARNRVR
jgi:hypothetical protein